MNKFENSSPEKVEQFLRDLYIDYSSTAFPNIKDAYDFYLFVLETLRDGGFSLHIGVQIRKNYQNFISRSTRTFYQ